MPGLLSTVFGDTDDGGQSAEAQDYDASAEVAQDVGLAADIGVGVEMGGSYQNLDGSTTSWSNSQEVGLDADLGATMGAVASAGFDQSDVEG